MADAGVDIMNGASAKQALVKVGYAESTAQAPARNGISAIQCVDAARKRYKLVEPGKLVSLARRALVLKLEQLCDTTKPKAMSATRISELAKTAQVCEQFYSDTTTTESSPRQFVDKLEWLQAVAHEMHKRKLQPITTPKLKSSTD